MIERETPRFKELSMRGNASALYGTYDRNDYVLDASGGAQPGYVRMIGTRSSSDDYRDGNGNKVHSKYWRQSGTGIVGWTPNEDTTVEAIFDKSEAEAAYASNSMDGSQFDREGLTLRLTRKNLTPLFSKVNLTAYYNYADHIMDTYSLRRLTTMSTAASQVDHLMQGVKGKIELTPRNDTKVTLGVDYNQDIHSKRALTRTQYLAGMRIDDQVRATDMSFETIAGYGEVNHDLTNIDRLIGGYRFTRVEALRQIYYTDESNDRSLSSGFARYEHDFNVGVPLTTYLGAGHVQRAPDFWERGKSRAAFTINEEKTNQVDIGALFKSSNWQGSVSGFFAHHDDYILVSNTSGITPKNVDAHTFGGEADLSYSFLKSWSVEATLAYVRGYNDSEDKPLAQTSPLNSTLGVKYDDSVFIGGLLLRAVSGQDRVDVGWGNIMSRDLAQTGGFAVLSANLGWRPYQGVMITGGVDNILDKTYSEHISKTGTLNGAMSGNADYVDSVRVNEPGRTFWMRGSVKF
jgi:iron complex outermembrane receptor protein